LIQRGRAIDMGFVQNAAGAWVEKGSQRPHPLNELRDGWKRDLADVPHDAGEGPSRERELELVRSLIDSLGRPTTEYTGE
jgi:hypothetical protein